MAAEGETNVKDYGIFTDAVSTINNFNTNIKTEYDSIKDNINTIDDEEIFAGPAAESIVSDSEAIRKNIVSSYKNFQQMGKNLEIISANYQAGDAAANKQIATTKGGKVSGKNACLVDGMNSEIGNTMGDYSSAWNDGNWCADYVSHKLKENGYNYDWAAGATTDSNQWSIIKSMKDGGAKIHYGQNAADYEGKTLTDEDKNYVPQAGDVFTIEVEEGTGPGHTGFVVKDNGDGTITTIEGNTFKEEPGYKEKFLNGEVPGVVETHIRNKEDIYAYATPEK